MSVMSNFFLILMRNGRKPRRPCGARTISFRRQSARSDYIAVREFKAALSAFRANAIPDKSSPQSVDLHK